MLTLQVTFATEPLVTGKETGSDESLTPCFVQKVYCSTTHMPGRRRKYWYEPFDQSAVIIVIPLIRNALDNHLACEMTCVDIRYSSVLEMAPRPS